MAEEHCPPVLDKITLAEFRNCLKTAVDQRMRQFSKVHAISFRFEDDNTSAKGDAKNFQHIVHMLGFPKAEEFIIRAKDKTPSWTVKSRFGNVVCGIESTIADDRRGLVIVHYAGHGEPGPNGNLQLKSGSGKSIDIEFAWLNDVKHEACEVGKVDVLFIPDCCYSHPATRSPAQLQRTVEVVASSSFAKPISHGPGAHLSATARIAAMMAKIKEQNNTESIEIAELVRDLQAEAAPSKPSHAILVGASSLRIRLPGFNGVPAMPAESHLRACFSVHIKTGFDPNGLLGLAEWIDHLPNNVFLQVDKVYETDSQVIIFDGDWVIGSKLRGIHGITIICEHYGGDLWAERKENRGSSNP